MAKKEAAELFGLIEKFAGYGFNKIAFSTAYALIAYMTAYLKAHYPVEFMAALLSSDIPGRNFKQKDSLVEHIEDCQRMDVDVLPPDVNRSGAEFTVADGKICFGLSAIKGCGGAAGRRHRREPAPRGGPYRSLFDFCERLDPGTVNRAAIESLDQGRGLRFAGRPPGAMVRRHRSGAAGRRRGRRRSPQRPEGTLRRRRRRTGRDRLATRPARRARVGRTRAAGQGEGGAGLLPLQPSAGRARRRRCTAYCSHTHGRSGRA